MMRKINKISLDNLGVIKMYIDNDLFQPARLVLCVAVTAGFKSGNNGFGRFTAIDPSEQLKIFLK